jgi:hypothetical protein
MRYPSVSISTLILDNSDRTCGKPEVKEERGVVDLPPVVIQLTTDAEKTFARP